MALFLLETMVPFFIENNCPFFMSNYESLGMEKYGTLFMKNTFFIKSMAPCLWLRFQSLRCTVFSFSDRPRPSDDDISCFQPTTDVWFCLYDARIMQA